MSIIKKAICDNCKKEIPIDEWYFSVGDIIERNVNCDNAAMIFERHDLCSKCYNKIFKVNENAIIPKGE